MRGGVIKRGYAVDVVLQDERCGCFGTMRMADTWWAPPPEWFTDHDWLAAAALALSAAGGELRYHECERGGDD